MNFDGFMGERVSYLTDSLTYRLDGWLRRGDTWLAGGLKKMCPLEGVDYRESRCKRAADKVIAAPLATVALTPSLLIAVVASFQKPILHPFYVSRRQGVGPNETVGVIKFRTMPLGSDSNPGDVVNYSRSFSPEKDPRATGIGRILRAFELDEIPQLFQVLFGQLSLVGIRAVSPEEFEIVERQRPSLFERWREAYFEGIPSLFSLNSAINSRRKDLLRRQHLDIFYASHASLGFDLYILFRTALRMAKKLEQKIRNLKDQPLI